MSISQIAETIDKSSNIALSKNADTPEPPPFNDGEPNNIPHIQAIIVTSAYLYRRGV